jgi:hypothetical protein
VSLSSFATNVHSELAFILELSQFNKWFAALKHELSVTASDTQIISIQTDGKHRCQFQ